MKLCEPIWERQKSERSKAFYLFTLYRDLGPLRTINKVQDTYSEEQGKTISLNQLHKYSGRCEWVKRVEAYDDYVDGLLRLEHEQAILEMVKRHSERSEEFQEKIKELIEDPEFEEMSPTQKAWALNTNIHSYVKIALLERLSRGETTDKTETNTNLKAEKIDVFDDIRELKETIKLSEEDEGKL